MANFALTPLAIAMFMILKGRALSVCQVHIYLIKHVISAQWIVVYNVKMMFVHSLSQTKIFVRLLVAYGLLTSVSHANMGVRHVA